MAQLRQYSAPQTGSLFSTVGQFRIVEIKSEDARRITDNLNVLRGLIATSESMYPNIQRWFDSKVVPGLRSSQRIAYVAYEGDAPIASAVLKLGDRSKFCHLKIHRNFQDMDLGQMFFTQMTLEARHLAKEIHFTLPESLWCEKATFFQSFGFSSTKKALHQYRAADTELSCSAPLATVWSNALEKLPALVMKFSVGGYSLANRILISIRPEYADKILSGSKTIEIRKRFSRHWIGYRAVLYASHPASALVGEATIASIRRGRPTDIWSEFGERIHCTLQEFDNYVATTDEITAIELTDVTPYRDRVSISQVAHLVNENLRPPQSFCDLKLDSDNPWTKAVSIAALLHGRFAYVKV
ncbi:MAG: ASCH domain-containing protein [Terriglobales bacterium]|jgi:predicted transcriptional regulator